MFGIGLPFIVMEVCIIYIIHHLSSYQWCSNINYLLCLCNDVDFQISKHVRDP